MAVKKAQPKSDAFAPDVAETVCGDGEKQDGTMVGQLKARVKAETGWMVDGKPMSGQVFERSGHSLLSLTFMSKTCSRSHRGLPNISFSCMSTSQTAPKAWIEMHAPLMLRGKRSTLLRVI